LPRRPVTIVTVLYLGLNGSYSSFSIAGCGVGTTMSSQSVRIARVVHEAKSHGNNSEDYRC
jgi:hypothetical protein